MTRAAFVKLVLVGWLVAAVAAACGGTSSLGASAVASSPADSLNPKLTADQARAIADRMLQALNTGDYEGWTRDFADPMRAAVPESVFNGVRDQVVGKLGKFISIQSIEMTAAQTPGHVRWVVNAQFEKALQPLWLVVPEQSDQIVGVHLPGI